MNLLTHMFINWFLDKYNKIAELRHSLKTLFLLGSQNDIISFKLPYKMG